MSSTVKPKEYQTLRRLLLEKGWTIASWARENGYPPSSVYDALKGHRNGVLSTAIRRQVKEVVAL
jgi:gp16 family phage-associated protein